MHARIRPFAFASLFLVGCAVGGASSHFIVPPATAQQQATLTRWEYHCFSSRSGITARANQLGAEGWEMIAAAGSGSGDGILQRDKMIWCFKRPRP